MPAHKNRRKTTLRPPVGARAAAIDKLRLFTAIANQIGRKNMTPAHKQAIAEYAARRLPKSVLQALPRNGRRATDRALRFIFDTLEHPAPLQP